MKARGLSIAIAAVAALALAGCGGGSSGGGGGGGGTIKQGGIFRLGTTNYIDTMNPFNYIEAESSVAYQEVYPVLVAYSPGLKKIVGAWATSWDVSNGGKTYTFHLRPGGKWSDGKPLTAEDAAWTANIIIKYQSGPTAVQASALAHAKNATAPNANTLVVNYAKPVGNALAQIETFYTLPKHVWDKYLGNNGKDLKTFLPEQHLPLVSGGPFQMTQYQKKGTTVFKPNPGYNGPKPHVDAVALVYYTNSDSMIADLKSDNLDAVDQVPFSAVKPLESATNVTIQKYPSGEITNITWNDNPHKTKNRELLDPRVKHALSMCVNRKQIIDVVFNGYATTDESLLGHIADGWQNPHIKPLEYNCAKGNQILDQLGYKRGANGIRIAPASGGQPAHPMQYQIMVPNSLDFNGDREFAIVQQGFQQAGVKVTEQAGGDSTAAYAIETGPKCDPAKNIGYNSYDIALWDWVASPDPDFQLSVVTKPQWCSWSDTGWDNPAYDKMYEKQATLVNPAQRRALVWKMDKIIHDNWLYTQLVNEVGIAAVSKKWAGYDSQMGGWTPNYFTDPHQVG